MTEIGWIRGRKIVEADLEQIRLWMAAHPQWSRRRLSQELARQWDWRTPTGQLKDIATRDLLNRLEAQGLLRLPARQRRGGRHPSRVLAAGGSAPKEQAGAAIPRPAGPRLLLELQPLSCQLVEPGQPERGLVAGYLQAHHYLRYPDPLGQLHYLVRDRTGRDVACLLFGAAGWNVAARDEFIGWSAQQRQRGLGHLANQTRFLILPGIGAPHLASHLLAGAVRQLRRDWLAQHGQALWLVETFVERGRFSGACYQAANWQWVGQTQGRTRNDRQHQSQAPLKDVYLLPLVADWRQRLCTG